jgi:signal peptidase I
MNNSADNDQQRIPPRLVTGDWLRNYEIKRIGWLRLLSGSMSPLINTGDQVLIEKIVPDDICIGDIITFWQGNILVTHRVIRKFTKSGNIYFVEKGDANTNYSWVDAQSMIGKVIKIKKSELEVDIDALPWKIFNRITGIGLLSAYALRAIGRRIPAVPGWSKSLVGRAFAFLAWFKNKTLRVLLHQ